MQAVVGLANSFRGMQDCFRLHPEMYASELEDDEDEVEEELKARESSSTENASAKSSVDPPNTPASSQPEQKKSTAAPHRDSLNSPVGSAQSGGEGDELLPKSAYDATSK